MAYYPLSTGGGKPPTNYGAGPQRPAGMKFPPRPRPPAGPSFRPPGPPPPTPPRPGGISNQFGRGTAPPAQGGQYAAATAPGTAGHGGPGVHQGPRTYTPEQTDWLGTLSPEDQARYGYTPQPPVGGPPPVQTTTPPATTPPATPPPAGAPPAGTAPNTPEDWKTGYNRFISGDSSGMSPEMIADY